MKSNNKTIFVTLTILVFGLSASLSWKNEIVAAAGSLKDQLSNFQLSGDPESVEKVNITKLGNTSKETPHQALLEKTFEQGVIMLHAKEFEHAITAFHKVLRIAPEMAEAYNNIGYALVGMEEFGAAQDFFISATELNENLISAYYGMAITFAEQENWALAIGAMETYRHRTTDDDPFLQQAFDYLNDWREQGRNNS